MINNYMDDEELKKYIKKITDGKGYHPLKYYRGLSKREVKQRIAHKKGSTWKTDKGKKTKTSSYTTAFRKVYPDAKSLSSKAKVTGIPLTVIKSVYNRGLGAWTSGHRPGASQSAWGYARVHSFIMKGCTYYSTDSDLVKKAKTKMTPPKKSKWMSRKKICYKG